LRDAAAVRRPRAYRARLPPERLRTRPQARLRRPPLHGELLDQRALADADAGVWMRRGAARSGWLSLESIHVRPVNIHGLTSCSAACRMPAYLPLIAAQSSLVGEPESVRSLGERVQHLRDAAGRLMPRTENHMYFLVDETAETVHVPAIWGTPKGPDSKALILSCSNPVSR
jgi:hypothetical protein